MLPALRMRTALIALLIVHGAIHLMGFAKAFRLAEVTSLHQAISRPLGALWLAATLVFLASAALVVFAPRQWWIVAVPAVVLSQILIVTSWSDAKFGTVANLVVLVALAPSLLDLRPSSFRSLYRQEVARGLARGTFTAPVTEADLSKLPPQLRTYLRRVGVVGKPRVHDFRAAWRAQMKSKPGGAWMSARVEQHSFFDEPTRIFLMEASLYGIPFTALHRYVGPAATMQVRVASLVDIVDARGPEMNQSETVTLFNDMCLLAPATLVDANVTWQEVDEHTVRGVFTNAGNTISAELSFDGQGDLVSFVSHDRYLSADGKTYERFPWSTPVRDYRDFGGLRLAAHGEAVWRQPDGDFVYGRFELEQLECNVGPREAAPHRPAANASLRVEALR